jgi:hypothetical protein
MQLFSLNNYINFIFVTILRLHKLKKETIVRQFPYL